MIDQESFGQMIDQVVERLYDHPYLQTHPIGRILVPDPARQPRGHALQRVLLDAIQALKPSADVAMAAHAWRTYRYLFLRFVQTLPASEVAGELMVSERQARRVYREALDALASILWDRYQAESLRSRTGTDDDLGRGMPSIASDGPTSSERSGAFGPPLPLTSDASLRDQEIDHLASTGRGNVTVLESVVEGLRPIVDALAERHGCVWEARLEPNLPRLSADRVVVRQVLLNLFTMAFGRGAQQLRLEASRADTRVELSLMMRSPTWIIRRIERAAEDEADARLAVSRRLVEADGGTFEAHSDAADGEVIAITFPAARQPRVLVVDDNPNVEIVFRRYLESAGCEVISARNGADGFRLAQETRPAAITLDVMMTALDGWETLQLLKNHPDTRDTPVIICSVLREEELARFLRAAEILPKPVERLALLRALARQGLPILAE